MSRSSNRKIEYRCSGCGKQYHRNDLTVKRVVFATMGEGYKTLASRTVAWLCIDCRDDDEAWNQEKHTGAPGLADVAAAKNG